MKYRKRIYEAFIKKISKLDKIIFLTGARQVGKSTLLSHLFPRTQTFVFDPIQDVHNVRKKPDEFLKNFGTPLILDEIQFIPQLLPSLKRFVDRSDTKGQYFLTGSQQLSIMKNVSESLAGRVAIVPISPMTPHEMYDEFDSKQNWFLAYIKNPKTFFKKPRKKISHVPSRLEAIWRGGLPGTINRPLESLPNFFSSYVQTYVERDVRSLEDIDDLSSFGTFLGLMAALTAQEINYSQLGRELHISPKTAQRWLSLLTYTYQWTELRPFHMNAIKRLANKPKGIIADTGLACYLQRITSPDALAVSLLQGAIFESYCFNMIKGFCSALPLMPNFYHWRSLAGAEVDIIVEINGRFYPIEIKSTIHLSGHDMRGLQAFKETYPHLNIATGIVIYTGDECYRLDDDIVAVPWDLR